MGWGTSYTIGLGYVMDVVSLDNMVIPLHPHSLVSRLEELVPLGPLSNAA